MYIGLDPYPTQTGDIDLSLEQHPELLVWPKTVENPLCRMHFKCALTDAEFHADSEYVIFFPGCL